MRALIAAIILLVGAEAEAKGNAARHCQKDDDCRFSYVSWCRRQCPPCRAIRRRATNRKTYREQAEIAARSRVRCRPCRKKCPAKWRGDRAICRKSRCKVVEEGPVTLKSFVDANIGGQLYKLKVRWNFSMGRFTPAARIEPPKHYAAAMEFSGLARKSHGPQHRLAEVELVLTEKEVLSPPGKRGPGRLVYHAKVTKLSWLGAPRRKGSLP